jgi:hypothetical protein
MLWSPDAGMLCIEPITFYPYKNPKGELSSGFMKLTGNTAQFSVSLEPMH